MEEEWKMKLIDICVENCTKDESKYILDLFGKLLPGIPVFIHDETIMLKVIEQTVDESRLAKYWASRVMAEEILDSSSFYDIPYVKFMGTGTPDYIFKNLSQLLKREWFALKKKKE